MCIFGQLLLVEKQRVPFLRKTASEEFEYLYKSYRNTVARATMTFQYGGYFDSKVIQLDLQFLFHKMISLSILNYFDNSNFKLLV